MFELLKQACDTARLEGCQFADARYLEIRKQRVMSRDNALSNCSESDDRGFGVRVLYNGAWGFASSPRYNDAEVAKTTGVREGDLFGATVKTINVSRPAPRPFIEPAPAPPPPVEVEVFRGNEVSLQTFGASQALN